MARCRPWHDTMSSTNGKDAYHKALYILWCAVLCLAAHSHFGGKTHLRCWCLFPLFGVQPFRLLCSVASRPFPANPLFWLFSPTILLEEALTVPPSNKYRWTADDDHLPMRFTSSMSEVAWNNADPQGVAHKAVRWQPDSSGCLLK